MCKKIVILVLVMGLLLTIIPIIISATPTVISYGTITHDGSNLPSRLYNDGTLVIEPGFINWTQTRGIRNDPFSPWSNLSNDIHRIVFTGPVTAGRSLQGLFSNLWRVTEIENIHYLDTSRTESMRQMFHFMNHLTELDLSSWNTSNVRDMSFMFWSMRELKTLNLSGWDTVMCEIWNGCFVFLGD